MMLKIILLVAIASVYSPVNDVCPGCYRPPSRHADHETASFPHRPRDRESDPHHAHAIHSQPSGTERDQHGDYHSLGPAGFVVLIQGVPKVRIHFVFCYFVSFY